MEPLLNEKAVAELLGVSTKTIQAWRYRGDGPEFVRISSKCVKYRPEDIEKYLSDRVVSSTSEETPLEIRQKTEAMVVN